MLSQIVLSARLWIVQSPADAIRSSFESIVAGLRSPCLRTNSVESPKSNCLAASEA